MSLTLLFIAAIINAFCNDLMPHLIGICFRYSCLQCLGKGTILSFPPFAPLIIIDLLFSLISLFSSFTTSEILRPDSNPNRKATLWCLLFVCFRTFLNSSSSIHTGSFFGIFHLLIYPFMFCIVPR